MKHSLLQEPIGSAAARHRGLRKLFETLGLDYYCEGQLTIEEACRGAAVDLETAWPVIADAAAGNPGTNWDDAPLTNLARYLEAEHHVIARKALFRIGLLFAEACRTVSDVRVMSMRVAFRRLTERLIAHMEHEELTLFPSILALEEAWTRGEPPPPRFEGGIRAVAAKLVLEHFEINRQFCELREAREAIATEQAPLAALFGELEALERHIHEYMSLENYIALPRAIALEDALTTRMQEAV